MSVSGTGNYLFNGSIFSAGATSAGGTGNGTILADSTGGGVTASVTAFDIGTDTFTGDAVLSGAGVDISMDVPETIRVAGDDGIGTLRIEQGARLTSRVDGDFQHIRIGTVNSVGANGTVTVDGTGSFLGAYGSTATIRLGQSFTPGAVGAGTLNVENSASVGSIFFEAGFGSGGVADLNVDGAGSLLHLSDTFADGAAAPINPLLRLGTDNGFGNLDVTDGAEVRIESTAGVTGFPGLWIGTDDGEGNVFVNTGGTINLSGSGTGDSGVLDVGRNGGNGLLRILDAGSTVNVQGGVQVGSGSGAIGDLEVTVGGVLNLIAGTGDPDSSLRIGVDGGDGFAEVRDAGSEINIAGNLGVGLYSASENNLDILEGGRVVVTNLAGVDPSTGNTTGGYYNINIARGSGAQGEIIVDGDGSFLGAYGGSPRVTIARDGSTGILAVSNGGDAGALSFVVGRGDNADGTLLVTGAGSTVTVGDVYGQYGAYDGNSYSAYAGGITLGRDGAATGTLDILDGGVVNVVNTAGVTSDPFINIGRDNGSEGFLTVSGTGSQLNVVQAGGMNDPSRSDIGFLNVGRNGTGTLIVESGGEVNMSGTGSILRLGRDRNDGPTDGNENLLEIRSGGAVNVEGDEDAQVSVAHSDGTVGRLIVDGIGSELNISSDSQSLDGFAASLLVGRRGVGTSEVTNGGTITIDGSGDEFPALIVGGFVATSASAGDGSLVVDGVGSSVTVAGINSNSIATSGFLSVGRSDSSTGSLSIVNGGTVALIGSNAASEVGGTPGSQGSVVIDGAGSLLNAGVELLIATDRDADGNPLPDIGGDGAVTIVNGGVLEADEIAVGNSGELDADGSIIGNVFLFGRFEIAGDGVGSANVDGDFLSETTSTIAVDITDYSGGVGDSLIVTGAGNFDEGVLILNITNAASIDTGETYTLATANGGIILTTSIVQDESSGREFEVSQVGMSAILTALAFGGATDGNDDLTGTAGDDVLDGLGGDDTINGLGGDDILIGGLGADALDGGTGNDTASYENSAAGVTVVIGGGAATGGEAAGDTLTRIENLTGSAQDDTLEGNSLVNILVGGSGADDIRGAGGADVLNGETGDDLLLGEGGADTIDGGTGNDTASYETSNAAVTVRLAGNVAQGGHAAGDTLIRVENLIGSTYEDTLEGNGLANELSGGSSDDTLNGAGGADTLNGDNGNDNLAGGGGADILNGGTGTDTANYNDSNGAVTVDLDGNIGAGGHAAGDTFSSIENLIGSRFADTLQGRAGVNVLMGGAQGDTLSGLGGNDQLFGGTGDDVLEGGVGGDILSGQGGRDEASYVNSTAGVDIDLTSNTASGGHANADTLIGIENVTGTSFADDLRGNVVANTLIGGDGDDTLNSAGGSDTVVGGLGDDELIGGGGADVLDGGSGIDTVSYISSTAIVRIDLQADTASGGHANGDDLDSIENIFGSRFNDELTGDDGANSLSGHTRNDTLDGGLGDDTLDGGTGSDTLMGGAGDDILIGGTGVDILEGGLDDDTLTGGSSSDIFVFSSTTFGQDTITDFQNGTDLLDFTAAGLGFSDFTATQSGADTVLTYNLDPAQSLTLTGINVSAIDALDFV